MPAFNSPRAVQSFFDSLNRSSRSLPVSIDGRYDYETDQISSRRRAAAHSTISLVLKRLRNYNHKSLPELDRTIDALYDKFLHPNAIDDRKGLFSDLLTILSFASPDDPGIPELAAGAVSLLYNTVPHPPAAFLGPAHSFRQADGGGNSLQNPEIGRAGTPYARSVQPQFCTPPCALPDPGLIFDTLLKRREGDNYDHPAGSSSFTFAFATLVTHSVFRTNTKDSSINDTSSYLDLSPLYGQNQDAQDLVRDKESGCGLLHPDTFSEDRLVFLPPAANVILVIFSRNHNFIAERLLKINERKRWKHPPPDPGTEECKKQDEEIFQTARLVNCGHFMSTIIGDYAAGFLGLSNNQFWDIPAFGEMKTKDGRVVPRGQGNHVSVEFNLLYRWHATLSARDVEWTERVFNRAFNHKPFDQLTLRDLCAAMTKLHGEREPLPHRREFAGLKRGPDGRFSDDELAKILLMATQTPGGGWRAQGTPGVFRIIEILGIEQARKWGVCTMNEFRRFLNLKEFETFEEWNHNPEVVEAARKLYGHINNLELYTGLQAEETMPVKPGSCIAAGYTTTRAVLGDAIAMVRGDRFYTTDFTPGNLTAWGYQDCMRDPHNGGFGGEMPKLLMRALPRHYRHNNVYGLFPFFTPERMNLELTTQHVRQQYDCEWPATLAVPTVLNTFEGIRYVFEDGVRFKGVYGGGGEGYGPVLGESRQTGLLARELLFPTTQSLAEYRSWFRERAEERIKVRSWNYGDRVPGNFIDVVTHVINGSAMEWAAEHLCGILLKTEENPRGLFTEQEIYDKFSILFKLEFLAHREPEHEFSLRHKATKAHKVLAELVENAIMETVPGVGPHGILANMMKTFTGIMWPTPRRRNRKFLAQLNGVQEPLENLVSIVLGIAVCTSMNVAHAAAVVVDFYLKDEYKKEHVKILELVGKDDAASAELLLGYVREALRLDPPCGGLFRSVEEDAEIPQGERMASVSVRRGDRVWASFRNAHIDPNRFPNPEVVDPTRPKSLYNLSLTNFQGCPGPDFVEQIVAEIFKVVFKQKNLRRAEGSKGHLAMFTTVENQTVNNWYITPTGSTSPFPGPMHLMYDD